MMKFLEPKCDNAQWERTIFLSGTFLFRNKTNSFEMSRVAPLSDTLLHGQPVVSD